MELVHAPVPELKGLITQSFEEWAGKGRSCAVSGEGTALIFLPALRAASVNWSRITLFWTHSTHDRPAALDDRSLRAGRPDDDAVHQLLLAPLGAKAPRAIRMPSELPLDQAAARYDATLEAELHDDALDLAILGAGEDGHVAALFPSHPALTQDDLRVVAVDDAPRPPKRRLSLTMGFLLRTKQIWIVAIGPRKLPVLHAALAKTQRSTPLDVIVQQHRDVTVFTDQVIRRR